MGTHDRLDVLKGASALVLATALTLVSSIGLVLASGYDNGQANCYQQGYIWSEASVEVRHVWSGGDERYNTPYRQYVETGPISGLTWWTVEWDFESDGAGAYCTGTLN